MTEALGAEAQLRRVRPRWPFALFAPRGPIDPAEDAGRAGSPIAPPFPDILVASGRRTVPYLHRVRRLSGGRTFTVFLKDPRLGCGVADLLWVPMHDRLRGPNVVTTVTGPHRISASRLAASRAAPDPRLASLGRPRVAVLLGGDSRHHGFTAADVETLAGGLAALAADGAALMVTPSRRTPARLAERVAALAGPSGFSWDGSGENPLVAMLALADAVVVTADSVNMLDEAVAPAVPVLAFEPTGGHRRLSRHLEALIAMGRVHRFKGRLEAFGCEPLDTTPLIAEAVRAGLAQHRARFRAD